MPAYGDIVLKLERKGVDWYVYDTGFRLAQAKRAMRGLPLVSWGTLDFALYVDCPEREQARWPAKEPKAKAAVKNTASINTSSSKSDVLYGTCWKFQHGSCDGTCLWPSTHACYKCGAAHPTKSCPEGPPTASPREPFRSTNADLTQISPETLGPNQELGYRA